MATCDVCGEEVNMPYNCGSCGGTYCSAHRLPENHSCPGLEQWNDPDAVFDSGFDDSVDAGGSSGGLRSKVGLDTGPGGPLAYFRGNFAYLFLGLSVVVFGLQFLVAPLFGAPPGSPAWYDIFTLSTANPEFVWTWFVSIFAHGGITHLLFNAIALYFFGPIVERQVGSRKFAALFLVSGIAAGLGQVGLALFTGEAARVLGASGAIMAIMGVLSMTAPDLKVLLFFVIPMSVRTLTILFAGFSIFMVAANTTGSGLLSGVAHFAHLVGLFIGLWYGNRIKGRVGRGPQQLNLGPGRGGPGGPGGPGRRP
ncbi:rhomboid family intramembrane serine protease [Natronomonas marina]|uniref:rhomboid family intramembrane serine protease n=1 Tax=Natronomonas marina TaxID=2961939 RepID=UPI0020C998F4|nr:rhomboid family intramembrane serine protease [Natronomonas marina]